MKLIIEKYQRVADISKLILRNEDVLEDVVCSYCFTFSSHSQKKASFAMFTFNYLLDKHEDQINLSTEILIPNEETDECYFWNIGQSSKKEVKLREVLIDGNHLSIVKKVDFELDTYGKSFSDLYNNVIDFILTDHDNFKKLLKENSFDFCNTTINKFRRSLKSYLDKSFNEVKNSLLAEVTNYDKIALSQQLDKELIIENKSTPRKLKL